jgi:hypothetical protein
MEANQGYTPWQVNLYERYKNALVGTIGILVIRTRKTLSKAILISKQRK